MFVRTREAALLWCHVRKLSGWQMTLGATTRTRFHCHLLLQLHALPAGGNSLSPDVASYSRSGSTGLGSDSESVDPSLNHATSECSRNTSNRVICARSENAAQFQSL